MLLSSLPAPAAAASAAGRERGSPETELGRGRRCAPALPAGRDSGSRCHSPDGVPPGARAGAVLLSPQDPKASSQEPRAPRPGGGSPRWRRERTRPSFPWLHVALGRRPRTAVGPPPPLFSARLLQKRPRHTPGSDVSPATGASPSPAKLLPSSGRRSSKSAVYAHRLPEPSLQTSGPSVGHFRQDLECPGDESDRDVWACTMPCLRLRGKPVGVRWTHSQVDAVDTRRGALFPRPHGSHVSRGLIPFVRSLFGV